MISVLKKKINSDKSQLELTKALLPKFYIENILGGLRVERKRHVAQRGVFLILFPKLVTTINIENNKMKSNTKLEWIFILTFFALLVLLFSKLYLPELKESVPLVLIVALLVWYLVYLLYSVIELNKELTIIFEQLEDRGGG